MKWLFIILLLVVPIFFFAFPVEAQQIQGGSIGFSPNQIPWMNASYVNGVWSFGSKVNVSISFRRGGLQTAFEAFTRSAGAAKFVEVMLREKDRIHWGLNITNLPLGLANQLDEVQFKFETKEKIEFSSFLDDVSGLNISDFSIPTLNLGFRFDDLQTAGFDLNISSSLEVSVLKVKGKTSLLLDPITYSSNVITVTGYVSGTTPWAFNDLWNGDKAGLLNLTYRSTLTGTDANAVALTTNARPTDLYVLGGVANDLYVNVTSFLGLTSAIIQLNGTDSIGGVQTEDLAVVMSGVVYATKYFHTVITSQVTAFVGIGNFSYAVTQGQWGVVWKQATTQYTFDAKVVIGDNVISTFFTDTNKQIKWNNGVATGAGGYVFWVRGRATLTLGQLDDLTTKTTSRGCQITIEDTSYDGVRVINSYETNAVAYCYDCTFQHISTSLVGSVAYPTRLWNCLLVNCYAGFSISTSNFNNLIIYSTSNALTRVSARMNRITVMGCTNAVYTDSFADPSLSVSDLYVRQATRVFDIGVDVRVYNGYLINVDSNTWNCRFNAASVNIVIYRQYTFDLKVSYPNDTAYENSNVTLFNNVGAIVFTALTNSSGLIATQTVSRGFYNQTGGNTLYDYAPFTLNITSSYGNYSKVFTLTEKTDWEIALTVTAGEDTTWYLAAGFILAFALCLSLGIVLVKKRRN